MKNRIKLFGIIALVAVIGFSMVGCFTDPDVGLDGNWRESGDQGQTTRGRRVITISGNSGVFTGFSADPYIQEAVNKGIYEIGGPYLKNLTNTGNLTWSGQELAILGSEGVWLDCTITLSSDGETFQLRTSAGSAGYTRQ